MPVPILATKLYIPPPRPGIVPRPRLVERLNEGLRQAVNWPSSLPPPALAKPHWPANGLQVAERPVAWLSLDEGDNDPTRFLAYLVAALQTIAPNIGAGVLGVLQCPAAAVNRIDSDSPAQ